MACGTSKLSFSNMVIGNSSNWYRVCLFHMIVSVNYRHSAVIFKSSHFSELPN